jgi:hypothetical protein
MLKWEEADDAAKYLLTVTVNDTIFSTYFENKTTSASTRQPY